MYELIKFFTDIFLKLYSICNVQFFSDFPLGFIDLSIICLVISFMFKFAFGGFKEIEVQGNHFNNFISSRSMSNLERKAEIRKEKRDSRKLEKNKTLDDIFKDSM